MSLSRSGSDLSLQTSDSEGNFSQDEPIEDMVLQEPLLYILSHFLTTEDGKNITTVLDELVTEIKEIKSKLSS